MTVIPNFILKRMYRSGSFRPLPGGVGFDIVNTLGPGQISQINGISLNGTTYAPSQIQLLIDDKAVPADSITDSTPATFFLNQVITCQILEPTIAPGRYDITLDLVSKEAGKVTLTVQDTLAAHSP